jgi:hypothetical protein
MKTRRVMPRDGPERGTALRRRRPRHIRPGRRRTGAVAGPEARLLCDAGSALVRLRFAAVETLAAVTGSDGLIRSPSPNLRLGIAAALGCARLKWVH